MKKIIKRYLLFIVLPLLALNACRNKADEDTAVVNADFSYSASNKVYLHELLPDSWPVVDSAITDDEGRVSFEVINASSGIYTIGTDRDNLAILQTNPGESQHLAADIRQIPYTYRTKGSRGSKMLEDFKKKTIKHLDIIDSLFIELNVQRDSPSYLDFQEVVDSMATVVREKQKDYQLSLVRNNKDILAVLVPLFQPFGRVPIITISEYPELFMDIEKNLMEKHPDNPHVLELHKRVERYRSNLKQVQEAERKLKPDMPAPGFAAPDATGKSVRLSEFQGNYVVLNFWSEENENYMKKMDSLYEVVEKRPEVKLLTLYNGKDKLLWQRTASKYNKNTVHMLATPVVLRMYNSKDKGRILLVSPQGKIIRGKLKAAELQQVLEELK